MTIKIRQIDENDWQEFREVRLKALQSDAQAFGSHYEREVLFSKQKWIEWVSRTNQGIFLIYDADKPIGTTGIYIPQDTVTKTTAVLWGSWLESDYRRKGISDLMYKTRIDWAKQQPEIRRIEVSHRESNVASKYANQKHGFKLLKTEDKVWHDGISEKDVIYELKL